MRFHTCCRQHSLLKVLINPGTGAPSLRVLLARLCDEYPTYGSLRLPPTMYTTEFAQGGLTDSDTCKRRKSTTGNGLKQPRFQPKSKKLLTCAGKNCKRRSVMARRLRPACSCHTVSRSHRLTPSSQDHNSTLMRPAARACLEDGLSHSWARKLRAPNFRNRQSGTHPLDMESKTMANSKTRAPHSGRERTRSKPVQMEPDWCNTGFRGTETLR